MKEYLVLDELGGMNTYAASDMRMALVVHQQIVGTEPVSVEQI